MFELPAGERRYRALELLVKQARLVKTALLLATFGKAAWLDQPPGFGGWERFVE